ncbi:hypothetical protein DPMN_037421 [Dreissena polymorpha]|uniref:Uncharacterized protein n=1 Tax=Dreissena polymorpha TaxID=45954 RepID=A0A9D4MEH1_DREPO|nr:hypothetical protein DPMN_037421 [Dreissena polymorpha]
MNLLTKFHEDWTINANVDTAQRTTHNGRRTKRSQKLTMSTLCSDINKTNVLTKFHDNWAKNVTSRVFTRNTAPPPGSHLHEDWASNINVLTKFHEDQTINVASRMLTRRKVDNARRTTDKRRSQKRIMSTLCLENALSVWSPHQSKQLEMVQRRAASFVKNDYSTTSSTVLQRAGFVNAWGRAVTFASCRTSSIRIRSVFAGLVQSTQDQCSIHRTSAVYTGPVQSTQDQCSLHRTSAVYTGPVQSTQDQCSPLSPSKMTIK